MDCITNGLDTATAYDIVKALRVMNLALGNTEIISLLQVSPLQLPIFSLLIPISAATA